MAKKNRISDIAHLAGVSAGTVDRIIHNRGNVSPKAREAVEQALAKLNYKTNIHLSAISLRKSYKIAVATPRFNKGDYWEQLHAGIANAANAYDTIDIECIRMTYDQFDLYSCRSVFDELMRMEVDGAIIGPTFREETLSLTDHFDRGNIPYVFVDSFVDGSSPAAFFSANHHTCGYLIGKLISSICGDDSEFVLFQAVRVGDSSANTTILRKQGFKAYFDEHNITKRLHIKQYHVQDADRNETLIGDFFNLNPKVKGAVVLSSRGHIIADYLTKHRLEGIKLICVDLTQSNQRAIIDNKIDFVVGQRPLQQGFKAYESLVESLVYGTAPKRDNYMPLDIIVRENIEYYDEFSAADSPDIF